MAQIAKKIYVDLDGNETRHASPVAVLLRFDFTDGQSLSVDRADVGADCMVAAGWHGLAQKIGDTYASADDADDAFQKAAALYERLCENTWIMARESAGPRISILAEAVVSVKIDHGLVDPADRDAAIKETAEKAKDKTYRENATSRPDVIAHMDRIKAERATARAAKSATAAQAVESDVSDL